MPAIDILKEEIIEIKTMNTETERKLKYLEEEIEVESEDDAEKDRDYSWPNKYDKFYSCNYSDIHIREISNFEAHMKSNVQKGLTEEIKCFKCECSCTRKTILKKHINTNHSIFNEE